MIHCCHLQAIPYLSAAGFGAELLGVFGNGTVQSFIDARTLTPSGKDISLSIVCYGYHYYIPYV